MRPPHRVDADLGLAGHPAEVLVELGLDAGLADLVSGLVQLGVRVELLLRDFADVAEHLRAERLVRIVPQVRLLDLDTREVGLVLVEVRDLVLADGRLHGDRIERVVDPRVDLLRKRDRADVEDPREPPDHLVAPLRREVADPELHRRARDVVDDHSAVAVEDRAARSLQPDRPQLVALGRSEVRLARQDLQRPEPEEQHREHREREHAEDSDAQREARGQPVRRLDARVGREES